MRTRVGGVYRYRGSMGVGNYWTIYEQEIDSWYFCGAKDPNHDTGQRFRGLPGEFKNQRWEELV